VQVEFQLTHSLKGAWFQTLSASNDFLVSNVAFKCNLHRYGGGRGTAGIPRGRAPVQVVESSLLERLLERLLEPSLEPSLERLLLCRPLS
jgi:hypothetical protein